MEEKEAVLKFSKYLNSLRFVAHRLGFLMQGYPENSLENLESIFESDEVLDYIYGIEFDIQFTEDHIPVINHDASTSDISEESRVIRKSPFDEIGMIKCGYRRSTYISDILWEENKTFYLKSLETLLAFIADNKSKFGDRIIKIESKNPILNKEDIISFNKLLYRYNILRDNMIHLSFFPWNLKQIREFQIENGLPLTKTDLLVDNRIMRPVAFMYSSYLDGISLGLKESIPQGSLELSERAKNMYELNKAFSSLRNGVKEEWVRKIIERYGSVGIYTVNNINEVIEFLNRLSLEFLDEYADRIIITSDNPKYIRQLGI